MVPNKQKLSENPILIAVSLLEAASLYHDASIAVQEVIVIVKSRFPSTTDRRSIDGKLMTLFKSLTIISDMVKSRSTACAPTGRDVSYARTCMNSSGTISSLTGNAKLECLVKQKSQPISPPKARTNNRKKINHIEMSYFRCCNS